MNAIDLCNACDANPADPASTAGYCIDCHRKAVARRLRRDDHRAALQAARQFRLEIARTEAARRNQAMFGTDPSWYGQ